MAYLSVGDCRLFYLLDGPEDRPVVMFSNSVGSDLGMWDTQVPSVSKRFRVLRYDSRGHGRSDAPQGPYTIDRLGLDAAMLIDGLGLRQVSFCGLSKGGMVGMWLGANAPHMLNRLVLANTSSNLGPPEFWDERIRVAQADGMAALADVVINRWFTPEFIQRAPGEIDRCRRMLVATPADGYAACCAAIRDMDLGHGDAGDPHADAGDRRRSRPGHTSIARGEDRRGDCRVEPRASLRVAFVEHRSRERLQHRGHDAPGCLDRYLRWMNPSASTRE